jgi:Domain of unknown function (DUF4365)
VAKRKPGQRPRRTRGHVIAAQGLNFVEKFFIDKGFTADRPGEDYGYDLIVTTFDADGYAESGELLIQLKASDGLTLAAGGIEICFAINVRHYELWTREPMPVYVILYDARSRAAYWLYVQEYFAADSARKPRAGAKTVTLRVPAANELNPAAIDSMRDRKATILSQLEGKIRHHGKGRH